MEMAEAEDDVKAFLATQKNTIDESNVTLLADADALSNGNILYQSKCAVCHGKEGEGGIGPNLTDEYWIHGGSMSDIFKTIKNGVPEMGMIAWKNDLRARDMQEVASYIKTLVGTTPANPKDPQGEIYTESESVEEPQESK
jgi:cytochrome c oxidase cbb3-type subunit 3